jgi:ATP-dependent helicase HrpA
LRAQLGDAAQLSFADVGASLERRGLRRWDCGDLPESLTRVVDGKRVTGYPALVDDGDSVSIALYDTREAAEASMRAGVVRLIRFALRDAVTQLEKGAPGFTQAALQLKTTIPTDRLQADLLLAVCDRAFIGDDPLPRSEAAFADQVKRARTRLPAVAEGAFRLLGTTRLSTIRLASRSPPGFSHTRALRPSYAPAAMGSSTQASSRPHPGPSSAMSPVT